MSSSWFSQTLSELQLEKPHVFVETGSYMGNGINNVKDEFRLIYSIELSQNLYSNCKELFSNQSNICLLIGDSPEVLSELAIDIDEPALFYLDAHYSGGETAFGKEEDKGCPVLRELEAIGKRTHKDIVIIGNMRLFGRVNSVEGLENELDFTHITQQKMGLQKTVLTQVK